MDWNLESSCDASSLYYGTKAFQFIVTLVVVSRYLQATRPLTKQLQASDFDIIKSVDKITLLFAMLKRFRSEIEINHNSWYEEAVAHGSLICAVPWHPKGL